MIEAIAGLFMAALAGIAYIFKTQRDAARMDVEDQKRKADQAEHIAQINQAQAAKLIKSAEERERLNGKAEEVAKRPERDFFE